MNTRYGPSEWLDGTRLEIPATDGTGHRDLYHRHDRPEDNGRHWYSGAHCAGYTWDELNDLHGEALHAAQPLYTPAELRPATDSARFGYIVAFRDEYGMDYSYTFLDPTEALRAHNAGIGTSIGPTRVLPPGLVPEPRTYHIAAATIAETADRDEAPSLGHSAQVWVLPDDPPQMQRLGGDLIGGAPGRDIIRISAIGSDADAVLADVRERYKLLLAERDGNLVWPRTPRGALPR